MLHFAACESRLKSNGNVFHRNKWEEAFFSPEPNLWAQEIVWFDIDLLVLRSVVMDIGNRIYNRARYNDIAKR